MGRTTRGERSWGKTGRMKSLEGRELLGEQTADRRGAEREGDGSACDLASLMGGTSDDSQDGWRGTAQTRETRTLKPRISPGS